MQYKIIKCTSYNSKKEIENEWFEVQYLSNVKTWWFFGERVWKTYKKLNCDMGGKYYVTLTFENEMKARDFINKCQNNVPSDSIVRKEVVKFI